MTDANQLLREYVKSGSELAFQELVGRYVDLVYSVAVRRLGGDEHLARDVVQTVFTDLARKASRLRAGSSLGGWLHRHTCFVSGTVRRTERRRVAREQIAHEMNELNDPSEGTWKELAPVLDEAIDQLSETDREAIILRYYERRDLGAVGAALGASEDAAQKRVSRAVEKLRSLLQARGVNLTAGALAALLGARAVAAAPAGMGEAAGSAALAAAGGTGTFAWLTTMMTSINAKLGLGIAGAALVTGVILYSTNSHKDLETTAPATTTAPTDSPAASLAPAGAPNAPSMADLAVGATHSAVPASDRLHLTIVAADSGRPVPGVVIRYRGWERDRFGRKEFVSNRNGECDVIVPRATITHLELTSMAEGFADTRLDWRTDRGETIPASYTLRLDRPVRIAGRVIDAEGNPVAGAKMGWNHQDDPAADTRPQSHEFGWIEVETDTDGRWEVNRIAPDMIRRLYGSPGHPEHVAPPLLMVSEHRDAERQLREGTYVFQMGRALTLTGTVVDPNDRPVSGALVRVGGVGEGNRREETSSADGTFVIAGCRPGKNLVTAEAEGFTAATVEVDAGPNTGPVRLKLQRGRLLRLRLVDRNGQPIPDANVWYNTFRNRPIDPNKPDASPPAQVEFSPKTDAEGRAVWDGAPEGDLTFSYAKTGFMRQDDVRIEADGQEHVITLSPALVVSGTVADAESGAPIPKFRIACGWPSPGIDGVIRPSFSNIDRFWLSFADGKFQHAFEEPLIMGMKSNPGYMLKFEAEGYASVVSRVLKEEEGHVTLEVKMAKAADLPVTVLLPDGSPAADVEVGLLAPGTDLQLTPGGFSRWNSQNTGGLLRTDRQGQFKLPPDDAVEQVAAASAAGFAQAAAAALRANPTLQLQPWGRIEGGFAAGARAAGRKISLGPVKVGAVGIQFNFQAYQVLTDAGGRFVFPQVPPGTWQLVHLVPQNHGDRTVWTHAPIQDVTMRPGETLSLTLGTGTRSVAARLRLPAGIERGPDARVFASVHTPFPKPPAEAQKDPEALQRWAQTPEVRALAEKARGYPLRENEDGTWVADEVPPGQYVLSVQVMGKPAADGSMQPVAMMETPVALPNGEPTDVVDLGELILQAVP